MKLPVNKTKIVCTIGPASDSPDIMEQMLRSGMDVARINFSHGDFANHKTVIENLRSAARTAGKRVAIMADLPGPKIRIGQLIREPLELRSNDAFTLTTEEVFGDEHRVSVSLPRLPQAVKPGNILFINDGFIQLEVTGAQGTEISCRILAGGELISAFTERDAQCLKFALELGVDAVSQSFVESRADIEAVRSAAAAQGYHPFIIAKIERSRALDHIDEILEAADGIMVARGDLGVETPIERIAVIQKQIIHQANLVGKPVITATQMLESMIASRRPTRAESTDVANAILDGTDCVMLSEESAMGSYPVEAVSMLARIAAAIEPHQSANTVREQLKENGRSREQGLTDLIALSVERTLEHISPAAVFVPTLTGATARSIARFRLPVWITGVSSQEQTCRRLQFSYGVYPVHEPDHPEDWNAYSRAWLAKHGVEGNIVIVTEGPSSKHPEANNRMEILDLTRKI
ncbi:MAG: pyruvate kinase [Proteobacteria bacterium]|nr:pyruvate kinase [Pseudomonadota bacterium]